MSQDDTFITTLKWIKLGLESEVKEGRGTSYSISEEDLEVAVFRSKGKIYAIGDTCPHSGGPLHMGDIEDMPVTCDTVTSRTGSRESIDEDAETQDEREEEEEGDEKEVEEKPAVICPWHGWTFFMDNGEQVDISKEEGGEKIPTYESKVKDGYIYIGITSKIKVDF